MTNTTNHTTGQADYRSYLLRLWRVSEEKPVWRASLEDPRTGNRMLFSSLDELFAFLGRQIRD